MRPSEPAVGENVYECFECGARLEGAEGACESCGGALRHVGRPRDL